MKSLADAGLGDRYPLAPRSNMKRDWEARARIKRGGGEEMDWEAERVLTAPPADERAATAADR